MLLEPGEEPAVALWGEVAACKNGSRLLDDKGAGALLIRLVDGSVRQQAQLQVGGVRACLHVSRIADEEHMPLLLVAKPTK